MSEQVVAEDLEARRSRVQVTIFQKSIDGRSSKPV